MKVEISLEMLKNAVNTLELGESATLEEIKDAYRRLARKYHPDTGGPEMDPEKFIEVSNSYRLLMRYASSFKIEFSEEAFLKRGSEGDFSETLSGIMEKLIVMIEIRTSK